MVLSTFLAVHSLPLFRRRRERLLEKASRGGMVFTFLAAPWPGHD